MALNELRSASLGKTFEGHALVNNVETKVARNGGDFVGITVSDRTGSTVLSIFDDSGYYETAAGLNVGDVIMYRGIAAEYRTRVVLNDVELKRVVVTADIAKEVQESSDQTEEQMEGKLVSWLSVLTSEHRDALTQMSNRFPAWKTAPHTGSYVYRRGLMEFTMQAVCHAFMLTSASYPNIKSQVMAGIIAHAIGRGQAFVEPWGNKLTEDAELLGIEGTVLKTLLTSDLPEDIMRVALVATPNTSGRSIYTPEAETTAQRLAVTAVNLTHSLHQATDRTDFQSHT